MQFEVTIDAAPNEVLAYCYNRVRDVWPEAVLITKKGACIYGSIGGSRKLAPSVTLYKDRKCAAAPTINGDEDLPQVAITISGVTVTITPTLSAKDAADKLASLPLWAHSARPSGRKVVISD